MTVVHRHPMAPQQASNGSWSLWPPHPLRMASIGCPFILPGHGCNSGWPPGGKPQGWNAGSGTTPMRKRNGPAHRQLSYSCVRTVSTPGARTGEDLRYLAAWPPIVDMRPAPSQPSCNTHYCIVWTQYNTWYLVDAARNLCVYPLAPTSRETSHRRTSSFFPLCCVTLLSCSRPSGEKGVRIHIQLHISHSCPHRRTRSHVPVGSALPLCPLCVIFSLSASTRERYMSRLRSLDRRRPILLGFLHTTSPS